MCDTEDEDERVKLIRRYVAPDRRYLKVGGALLGASGRDRAQFMRKLGTVAFAALPRPRPVRSRAVARCAQATFGTSARSHARSARFLGPSVADPPRWHLGAVLSSPSAMRSRIPAR